MGEFPEKITTDWQRLFVSPCQEGGRCALYADKRTDRIIVGHCWALGF